MYDLIYYSKYSALNKKIAFYSSSVDQPRAKSQELLDVHRNVNATCWKSLASHLTPPYPCDLPIEY